MNSTKAAIMITLFSCMSQGKNHYSRVSINKIQELLEKYHKIHVKRRWIFYCTRYLLDKKLITRKGRFRHDEAGLVSQIPSLHSFTIKGLRFLVSKRVIGALKLLKSMIKYVLKKDGRWPGKKDIGAPENLDQFKPSKEDWNNLLGGIPKEMI